MNGSTGGGSAALDEEHIPSRVGERTLVRTLLGFVLLTIFAAVVIVPFLYMLLISCKRPSELGNGRLLPDALRDMGSLRRKDLVWINAQLDEEQAVAINTRDEVPVGPLILTEVTSGTIRQLPPSTLFAHKLSIERPSFSQHVIDLLLEAQDTTGALQLSAHPVVYYPTKDGGWRSLPGNFAPRSVLTIADRLTGAYQTLINWPVLKSGNLVSWLSNGYPRWYINSLFVAICTVVLGLFFDSLAAFAFAKFNFPFRRSLFALLIATIMIPYPVTLVPTFFIFAKMGLYNTYLALIIPGLVSAFGIFLARQYIQTIPDDMIDAARVDGASDFKIYRHVILPTARPILAALAVFRFIYQWNTYLYPLVLTNRDSMKMVQLGLATMQDAYGTVDYGTQMAGAALAVIPILIVYAFMQRHFIAGITLGSVKD